MGLTKRYLEEVESRGWADLGTTICTECLVDQALVTVVRDYAGSEKCDYCGQLPNRSAASAPIEVLLDVIVESFKNEYEDPAEQMAYDGGYVGEVYDTWDLLREFEITDNDNIIVDLLRAIQQEAWCQRDPYAATPAQALTWGWDDFREFVKHRRRYTFLTVDPTTADGAGMLPMHAMPFAVAKAVKDGGLVALLPAGTKWWRLRPHSADERYSTARDIGTPPDEVARDNRMSPKGIGAFYGASTMAGAQAEVAGYAHPEHGGSFAQFMTTSPMSVVDLRSVPPIPSIFDTERRHLRAPIQFLWGFVDDITKIANPADKQNLDYVPTQIIAETFRYELSGPDGPIDGIIWRSSKDSSVISCVLFISSCEITDRGAETTTAKLVFDPSTVGYVAPPL